MQYNIYAVFLLVFLAACGSYKTSKAYKSSLPVIKKVAVLTPYAEVEQLYLENDFKQEKPVLDTNAIEKGKIYIQKQILNNLPAYFEAFPLSIDKEFQEASKKDMLLLLEEIKEHRLDYVAIPAYLNEFLKNSKVEYAILTQHIGTYKTLKRTKQDETTYNAKEALDVIFTATSTSALPTFPDDVISVLHLIIYDVKNQKLLYYAKEDNHKIDEPNVPIPTRAADSQIIEVLEKLKKDITKKDK
jgi:hypothetical protein